MPLIANLIRKAKPGVAMEMITDGAILSIDDLKVKFVMNKGNVVAYKPIANPEHTDRQILWQVVGKDDIDEVLDKVLK
jgi:hypothetical protein